MAEPWQCPACKTWLAPYVSEHRCDPDAGVHAMRVVSPKAPGGGMTITPSSFQTTTTNTGYPVTGATVTYAVLAGRAA